MYIEIVTNLKKILEERISDGKIEFKINKILRNKKHKFLEVDIDTKKKK